MAFTLSTYGRSTSGSTTVDLSCEQRACLEQLQHWLPSVNFDLQQRHLPTSISQDHVIAVGRLHQQNGQYLSLLASVPKFSQRIILAVFKEPSRPFIDFIAELDALSETADQVNHGYQTMITHSVLVQRQLQSCRLIGFNTLTPQLELKANRAQTSHTLYQNEIDQIDGLLVLFSNQPPLTSQEQLNISLRSLALNTTNLEQFALPSRDLNIPLVEPALTKAVETASVSVKAAVSNSKIAPLQTRSSTLAQTITSKSPLAAHEIQTLPSAYPSVAACVALEPFAVSAPTIAQMRLKQTSQAWRNWLLLASLGVTIGLIWLVDQLVQ